MSLDAKRSPADMTAAMRNRDQARLAPLRMAKAALMNREVEKGRALDEAEAQQVIASLIKQRRDSARAVHERRTPELAARETAEIATLEAYLPPPLDPAESNARSTKPSGDGRHVGEGPGHGDESGDGRSWPGAAPTDGPSTRSSVEAWRLIPPNFSPRSAV